MIYRYLYTVKSNDFHLLTMCLRKSGIKIEIDERFVQNMLIKKRNFIHVIHICDLMTRHKVNLDMIP